MIWASVGWGMARNLAARDADDMRPVEIARAPTEVRPLADALNSLFSKVETSRRHDGR